MVKFTKGEIEQKVEEAARILDIVQYLDRKPKALSGGQRQRVALGRAIVREPKVFLLDEPLSNLDAKLRTSMRSEISKLYKKLQTTFIYVTHDQVEAMTMGTRIVVMKDGFVQQIDTPRNLYNYPENKFVAGFIGTPQMNFFSCRLTDTGDGIDVVLDGINVEFKVPYKYFTKVDASYFNGKKPVILGVRAEHISADPSAYPFRTKCRVYYVEDLGVESQVYVDLNVDAVEISGDISAKAVFKTKSDMAITTDSVIDISIDFSNVHFFDAQTELSIAPRIPEKMVTTVKVKSGKMKIYGTDISLPGAVMLEDGEYTAHIPVSAVSYGNQIVCEQINEEEANGKKFAELRANGQSVFIYKDGTDEPVRGIDIDLKYCTFLKDDIAVKSGMPEYNVISAKLCRVRQPEINDKSKKISLKNYEFRIAEHGIECPAELVERLEITAGKDVFKHELKIQFEPRFAHITDNGIPAEIINVADYGKEKYAECMIGSEGVVVPLDKSTESKEISIEIDWKKIGIIDSVLDMKLI